MKAGYSKIETVYREVIEHDLEYVWIDTCYIDESSSAALTESINSICRRYEDAKVCFVYLFNAEEDNIQVYGSSLTNSQFSLST